MARVQGHSTRGLLTVQRPFPRGLLAGIALLPEIPQSLPPPHFLRWGGGGNPGKISWGRLGESPPRQSVGHTLPCSAICWQILVS